MQADKAANPLQLNELELISKHVLLDSPNMSWWRGSFAWPSESFESSDQLGAGLMLNRLFRRC